MDILLPVAVFIVDLNNWYFYHTIVCRAQYGCEKYSIRLSVFVGIEK